LQAKSTSSKGFGERADPFIKKRLLELAKHYERRISIGSNEKAAVEGEPEQYDAAAPIADWNHGRG
jgi:hypothetical protein